MAKGLESLRGRSAIVTGGASGIGRALGAALAGAGAHWDRIIDVNLKGVVNGVLAAYPLMIRQGHGHIVNTTPAAGIAHSPLTVRTRRRSTR